MENQLFGNGTGGDLTPNEEELLKGLYAGDGAGYESNGGRALIPENIDGSVVVALKSSPEDFKMMNLLKKEAVESPVREYTRNKSAGSDSEIFYAEGQSVEEDESDFERVHRTSKYMQTLRKVTWQLQKAKTIESAIATEKMNGIIHLMQGCESACFHGDSSILTNQFDSIPKQIQEESKNAGFNTVYDMRGKTMLKDGENAIKNVAQLVNNAGGTLSNAFMPPAIAGDFQTMVNDKLLIKPTDTLTASVPLIYPTIFGDQIVVSGAGGGSNKFYRVKGKITPSIHPDAPAAPTITVTPEANKDGSLFFGEDAGNYFYEVYAIDARGRFSQAGKSSAVAVAKYSGVNISITATDNKAKGFVLCRSKKDVSDGNDCREFIRIPKASTGATVYLDLNENLPGTGEMLLLSLKGIKQSVRWNQFMPATKVDMAPTNSLVIPFIIAMFGTPDVQIPWYNGLIKNIGYTGSAW